MQEINADEYFNEARRCHEGVDENGTVVGKDLDKAEKMYNVVLDHNIGNALILYCYGTLLMETNRLGLAVQILSQVVNLNPTFGEAWNNLGLTWRSLQNKERADQCFQQALPLVTSVPTVEADIWSNRAAMHVNEGSPDQCVEYCRKCLELSPDHLKASWHMALGLLEQQNFEEGWKWHESRLNPEAANYNIAERNYHGEGSGTPWWDGEAKGTVVIHGEQGLGDEIMFASCIPDLMERNPECKFILEPSPRMHHLYKRSFPDAFVCGTDHVDGRKWVEKRGKPDYKIALGSLPMVAHRHKDEDFPGTPYMVASPKHRKAIRRRFEKLGPRPKIGITWQGGVASTAVHHRSLNPRLMAPILQQDADFISFQYTPDTSEDVARLFKETGYVLHHWPEMAQARNIDRVMAGIAELDMLITVCQSAVHFAGSLGIPTLCLTPSKPSWRYGVVGNMPWYESVDLIRQEGDDWTSAIQEAAARLSGHISELPRYGAGKVA